MMDKWEPKFVILPVIDPETLRETMGRVIARAEPDGTLRVVYAGEACLSGNIEYGRVKACMRALPWPGDTGL